MIVTMFCVTSLLDAAFGGFAATIVNGLVVVSIVLVAASVSIWCWRRTIRVLYVLDTRLPKSAVERLLLVALVCGLVHYGATKEGGDRGGDPQVQPRSMPYAPTVAPVAVDSLDMNFPTNFPPVTNLCFWGIERGSNSVSFGIAWPLSMAFTNDFIDLYGNWRLASNGWARLAQVDVGGAMSNAVVEVSFDLFPTNAMEETAFFRAASQDDADGDGISDAYESWSLGTDPDIPDTDGDELPDGDELGLGTDPFVADSDGDGFQDGDETGYIEKSSTFEWYDTTGWATVYSWGYWLNDPEVSSWWCTGFGAFGISGHWLCGRQIVSMTGFETGYVAFSEPGRGLDWIFPGGPLPLSGSVMNTGNFMVAPYWGNTLLCEGDQNSYIRHGTASNGAFVVEFHDVRRSIWSPLGMSYQVILPPGTGSVVRVSYLSSDWWLDGDGAVVGVQATDVWTTNGYYNLTWDFSERGPILPQTTIDFHIGTGTSPILSDSDGDGLDDASEIGVYGTDPLKTDTDGDGLSDGQEMVHGTNPFVRDTDGDGLNDGWEVDNGLDPFSAVGDDGASGDPDGDGLDNAAECRLGTDPLVVDTDEDSISDFEEAVCWSAANPMPWLDIHELTNLTEAISNSQHGVVSCDLLVPVILQGVAVSNITVSKCGMVMFNRPGYGNPEIPHVNYRMGTMLVDSNCFTVAAYSGYLNVASDSSICVGAGVVDGVSYLVVEYLGMRLGTNSVSFQVSVPVGVAADRVCVSYADVIGAGADGRSASVGFQTFGGHDLVSYCWRSEGMIHDGLGLSFVIGLGTDPARSDTDGDGLSDGDELDEGTDPFVADMDLDGLPDGIEVAIGTNPFQPDTDGDGMNDSWEHAHMGAGFDPAVDNATDANPANDIGADPDDDGLTNGEECEWGTNPSGLDSDNDGVADGYDTDGDGVGDGEEIVQNSDPADASDGGLPNSRIPAPFYFGDPSGSHSEKYRLSVTPVSGPGSTPKSYSWLNEDYGQCETKTAMLKPGWKYEVRMQWVACRYPADGSYYPNYDYTLAIDGDSPPAGILLEDPCEIFQYGYYGWDCYGADHFPQLDGVAYIYVLAPPTISAPSAVGVNNDDDNGNGTPDWEDSGIVASDDDIGELVVSVACPQGMSGTVEVAPFIGATTGTLWKDRARTQSVGLSDTFAASPGQTARAYYIEGHNPSSSYEAEGVRAVFSCGGVSLTNEFRFTVVERIAEPITTERSGGQIVNPCCAVIGGTTKLKVEVLPSDFPESKIDWRVVSGSGSFSDATGREAAFVASGAEDEDVVVQVDVGDCPGRAPQFTMRTTTMHEVKIYPCAIAVAGEPLPVSQAELTGMLDEVNVIYRQVGLHFSLGALLMCVTNDVWATDGLVDSGVGAQIRNVMSGKDGIEVYFIYGKEVPGEPLGQHDEYGIIFKPSAGAKTLAHEIGHACGWGDIYFKSGNDIIAELYGGVRQSWLPLDWNNGTGCRFYDPMLTHHQIVQRLLMLGTGSDGKCDIPTGSVYGRSSNGDIGNISVGRSTMMTTSPHSL